MPKLILAGQRGVPANNYYDRLERRAQNVALFAADLGYEVLALARTSYVQGGIRSWKGVEVRALKDRRFWRQVLQEIKREEPEIVHLLGLEAGFWLPTVRKAARHATIVWTVDELPNTANQRVQKTVHRAEQAATVISTPSRAIQYRLLLEYGLRAEYVPDGYQEPLLEDIAAKEWGLRKGGYVALTATSLPDIAWIAEAYSEFATKKKLVIFHAETLDMARLQEKYPFLLVVPVISERSYHSLLRQAAVVIAAAPYGVTEPLLQAMGAGQPVIAMNHPLNEEILGTTGQIVRQDDADGLQEALRSVLTNRKNQQQWGKLAQKRAQNHFALDKVGADYGRLYHFPAIEQVPIDSVVGSFKSYQPKSRLLM